MNCQIIRKKLVKSGIMQFDGKPMKITSEKWVTEKCDTPIFGKDSHKRKVYDSCIEGWTHEENYMVRNATNKKLLAQATKSLHVKKPIRN